MAGLQPLWAWGSPGGQQVDDKWTPGEWGRHAAARACDLATRGLLLDAIGVAAN